MRSLVRRHPVSAFFVLACAVSWIFWIPLALVAEGIELPVLPLQHYYGALGPVTAALVTAAIIAGPAGPGQLWDALRRRGVALRWYLVALFGPVVLFALSATACGWYGGSTIDLGQYGRSDEFASLGLLGTWVVHTVTFGIGEETGWRGFALPRLQARHNALTATLLLTVFWACWHIPAFFYRPGYSTMGPGEIIGWFFSLLTGSILLTWLYNSSRGSVLVVALFHGSIDVAFTTKADPAVMNGMGFLIVIWAMTVLLIAGPVNLSRGGRQRIPSAEPTIASLADGRGA